MQPRLQPLEAALGYAADDRGRGVAYARLRHPGGEHLLRIGFRLRFGYVAREVAYAALTAVALVLRRRRVSNVRFVLEDDRLVDDVLAHGELSTAMVLPYVRLKCALNQFETVSLSVARDLDVTQRARAEIALNSVA
jgi:hypothetical protein